MRRLAALLALPALALGCSSLTPAQEAQYDRIKCEVQALEPLALADADYTVHTIEAGALSLDAAISDVQTIKANVNAVKAAFQTCRAQFPRL